MVIFPSIHLHYFHFESKLFSIELCLSLFQASPSCHTFVLSFNLWYILSFMHFFSSIAHITRTCWAREEWWNLSGILPLSNCHHDDLIISLPCVTPTLLRKYRTIDIHGCECETMFCNNEKLPAIICICKLSIRDPPKHSRVAIWFRNPWTSILSVFVHNKDQTG